MSCFSCFSSHEKKASNKRSNNERGAQLPTALSEKEPYNYVATQQNPAEVYNLKPPAPTAEQTTNTKNANANTNTNKDGANNIAAQTFSFRELATATKNFRQECLIGEGGFGRVYKGKLEKTEQIVAVKQLDRNGLQGNREFLVEVLMLSLLHQENLVNLIGYCADGDQRLLVYEYMPLGSLEDHLLEIPSEQKPLDWSKRMKIALGAAKEYQRTGQLTVKSDVYSFGVVLLELITGRRAIDTTRPTREQNLVSWAEPVFKDPHKFPELADPLLHGDFPIRALNQAIAVAAMCLHEEAPARPLMSDVVSALSFLGTDDDQDTTISPIPSSPPQADNQEMSSINDENPKDEESVKERERAVAEAIEWGSTSRNAASLQFETTTSL
ncbi:hypothetical protein M0R45_010386 [Rubus argutus]|uniref:Protein kinase domain-containing protein n=1 Tax=Rubus argutus TaxID=59490 RepID=A0AAW1YAQ9_RUBAR